MRILSTRLAIVPILAIGAMAQAQQAPQRFLGLWEGPLRAGAVTLRLALTVERDSAGALRGYMTSIDQANARMAATLSLSGDSLVVAMPGANARYTAVITGRDTLHGSFFQGAALPLDLVRVQKLSGAAVRPQDPKPPFPYRTEDVSIESAPGVKLAGTLMLPAGNGPFPAVVLVTGSGPQNRDEELAGHRPFLVLADYLARKGIASLRYDDRGVAKSTGRFGAATSVDFADDAEAAVKWLRSNPAIARDKIGVMGHSEGGLIAPIVAARSKDVGFIVLLAGPGVPGDSIILMQSRLIAKAAGAPDAAIETGQRINRLIFGAIRAGGDSTAIDARIRTSLRDFVATLPADQRSGMTTSALDQQLAQVMTPWFRYFLVFDPQTALRQVHVPVLAVNGTLDLQVPYQANLPAIDAALKAAGNKDYRVVELPNLNHLFQTTKTGSPSEYQTNEETMSPVMLELVSGWILQHFGPK